MNACADNDLETVKILIDQGAVIDQEYQKEGDDATEELGDTALVKIIY